MLLHSTDNFNRIYCRAHYIHSVRQLQVNFAQTQVGLFYPRNETTNMLLMLANCRYNVP